MQLEDQLRRYAEEVADPAAVGPDPTEVLGDVGEPPSRSARLALVACLVVLVAVMGGVLVARSRAGSPAPAADHSVTATVAGDQLAVSLTVDDPDVAYGDTLTAYAVITNVSDAPVTVLVDPAFLLQVGWGGYPTSAGDDHQRSMLAMVAAPYESAPMATPDPVPSTESIGPDQAARAVLAPGESVRIDAERPIDEAVRTGTVVVSILPQVVQVVDGREVVGPVKEVTVSVPVTIGPSPSGVQTMPDGVAAILADPQLVAWGAAGDAKGGVAGAFAGNIERSGDGWRLLFGATDGNAGPDLEGELRQVGGPGFIAQVDAAGTVTVEWIASP